MYYKVLTTDKFATIVLTHECNKRCKFCCDKYRGRNEYITIENVVRALIMFQERGVRDVLLVGGEPTMHPQLLQICRTVKMYGFNLILTTNYTQPEIIKSLFGIVDHLNISNYNHLNLYNLPEPHRDTKGTTITVSTLIYRNQLDTKDSLDDFIDNFNVKFSQVKFKFSTLSISNKWCNDNALPTENYLDDLEGERIDLFGEIEGILYRNCLIKRPERVICENIPQSLKAHVDGTINRSWERHV